MAVSAPLVVERMRIGDVSAVIEIERLSFSSPWPAFAFEQVGEINCDRTLSSRERLMIVGRLPRNAAALAEAAAPNCPTRH